MVPEILRTVCMTIADSIDLDVLLYVQVMIMEIIIVFKIYTQRGIRLYTSIAVGNTHNGKCQIPHANPIIIELVKAFHLA